MKALFGRKEPCLKQNEIAKKSETHVGSAGCACIPEILCAFIFLAISVLSTKSTFL